MLRELASRGSFGSGFGRAAIAVPSAIADGLTSAFATSQPSSRWKTKKLVPGFSAASRARIAQVPVNQLRMMKLLVNQTLYAQGLHATQVLGTLLDGIARHTAEGYAFQRRAAEAGFKEAVRERDEPFGDYGASTYKGPPPPRDA